MFRRNRKSELTEGTVERMKENSNLLRQGAFLTLGAIPAMTFFLVTKFQLPVWYFVILALAVVAILSSFFLRARGLAYVLEQKDPKGYFDKQAKTTLLGFFLFVACAIVGINSEQIKDEETVQQKVVSE